MEFYPLLQILLYLALLFVPPDVDRITIAGPGLDGTVELTRSGTEWSFRQGRLSTSEGKVIVDGVEGRQETPVGEYVAVATGFDWVKNRVLSLNSSTTLEKTADGFIFRRNQGQAEETSHRITYGRTVAEVSASSKIVVNVLGQVRQPGAYPIPLKGTLIDALAAAGGWTQQAGLQKATVIRGPAGELPTVTEYDVNAMLKGTVAAPLLQERDTIYVPESIF